MVDKGKLLPSASEEPHLYDGFDGTPPNYVNPIQRTDHVKRLLATRAVLSRRVYPKHRSGEALKSTAPAPHAIEE